MRLVLIAFECLLALASFSCSLDALSTDGEALLAFKMGLRNSDEVLHSWKATDLNPCKWHGIICDSQMFYVVSINLSSEKLWGNIAPDLGKLNKLERLALHKNSFYGSIPVTLENCTKLKVMLLQDNYLSGHIPVELGGLVELKILDLSSNTLSGMIPASLGNLQKLQTLNLSTNFLVGEIPQDGILKSFGAESFVGNLGLCGLQIDEICKSQLEEPSVIPDSSSPASGGVPSSHFGDLRKKPSKVSTEFLIGVLGAVGLSLMVAVICFLGCLFYHKYRKGARESEDISGNENAKVVIFHGDLPYTSKDIIRKIEMLDETNVIGYGGFGTVYKLVMDDGSMFAVKRLDNCSLKFDRLFERELEVLGSIKHRNLVNLRGYCNAPLAKLLIYDYLHNGSLEEILHDQDVHETLLNWGARLKVALGAGRGLAYLHDDCYPRIIHRDVKSSNILIGENLEPHVSDFGLARLVEDNISHVTSTIAGTFGYLAPEYLQSGRASEKTDVYSYGIVLLELISGKQPSDPLFVEKGLSIVGWAISLKKEKNLMEILDPRCVDASTDSVEALLHIAMLCLSPIPDDRPSMHEVVKMLEAEIMSPCPSDFYNSSSE